MLIQKPGQAVAPSGQNRRWDRSPLGGRNPNSGEFPALPLLLGEVAESDASPSAREQERGTVLDNSPENAPH